MGTGLRDIDTTKQPYEKVRRHQIASVFFYAREMVGVGTLVVVVGVVPGALAELTAIPGILVACGIKLERNRFGRAWIVIMMVREPQLLQLSAAAPAEIKLAA